MENTNTSVFNWERAQELMDNIKRMNDLLAVHTQADSSDLIIYQYEEKRDAFISELNQMFRLYSLVITNKTKRKKKIIA